MTTTAAIHNFNAGPSILPKEVFEEAGRAVLDYNNTGLSILEIGHRTPVFQAIIDEAQALLKELMGLDEGHKVLFLHGGASTQFFQVPMNLLAQNKKAAYTDTGIWAAKAIKEAQLWGEVDVVCSSKASTYNHLPKSFTVPPDAAYLHLTTNNTVYGTQWQDLEVFYNSGAPLVADMSSDILSRELNFNAFDLIYAGAQKNIGAAGVNVVVINERCLGKAERPLPTMMDYRAHIEAGSMLNTPPVFAVYVCLLTLRWLKAQGGVTAIEKANNEKAALFYNTLDSLPLFKGNVATEDRSKMNATFVLANETLEAAFATAAKEEGFIGIKGHRTTGGFRVSMYNALPLESVQALCSFMQHFAQTKA